MTESGTADEIPVLRAVAALRVWLLIPGAALVDPVSVLSAVAEPGCLVPRDVVEAFGPEILLAPFAKAAKAGSSDESERVAAVLFELLLLGDLPSDALETGPTRVVRLDLGSLKPVDVLLVVVSDLVCPRILLPVLENEADVCVDLELVEALLAVVGSPFWPVGFCAVVSKDAGIVLDFKTFDTKEELSAVFSSPEAVVTLPVLRVRVIEVWPETVLNEVAESLFVVFLTLLPVTRPPVTSPKAARQ